MNELKQRMDLIRSALKLFPAQSHKVDDEALAILVAATMDIPLEQFPTVLAQAVNDPQFMLHIPSSIRAAYQLVQRDSPLTLPLAAEAWGEVVRQISRVGRDGQPQFSHPLIERAVKALDWRELCNSENQVADRARFIQAYEQMVQRQSDVASMTPATRLLAEQNGATVAGLIERTAKQLTVKGTE